MNPRMKETADPNLNPFEKMEEEKQERKAKNELQRLRNVARLKNVKVPTVGVVTPSVAGNHNVYIYFLHGFSYFGSLRDEHMDKFSKSGETTQYINTYPCILLFNKRTRQFTLNIET